MSRWLKNVGQFLEKLDDRAEKVAAETHTGTPHALLGLRHNDDDDENVEFFGQGKESIDSILASRGLLNKKDGDDDEEDDVDRNYDSFAEDDVFLDDDDDDDKATVDLPQVDLNDETLNFSSTSVDSAAVNTTQSQDNNVEKSLDISMDAKAEDISNNHAVKGKEVLLHTNNTDQNSIVDDKNPDTSKKIDSIAKNNEMKSVTVSNSNNKEKVQNSHKDLSNMVEPMNDSQQPVSNSNNHDSFSNLDNNNSNMIDLVPLASVDSAASHSAPPSADQSHVTIYNNDNNISTLQTHPNNIHKNVAQVAPASFNNANNITITTTVDAKLHESVRVAQKEARTLRRHVVSINTQLEHAEAEIQAQRVELERAAERLEKDRKRHKEERELEKKRHADEIRLLKSQQEALVKEVRANSNQLIEDARREIRALEEQRMLEGGTWNKELADALEREGEMSRKLMMMEDEKSTLLSHVSTLQAQQEALGSRLESLMQSADLSMERERDAENRLDEALTLHARQICQRQAREAELERTIAELGTALVAARESANGSVHTSSLKDIVITDNSQSLRMEIDNLTSQLDVERQRNKVLQQELKEMDHERAEEAENNSQRILRYDLQVTELNQTISQLQADLSRTKSAKSTTSAINDDDHSEELQSLSKEVLRLREKLSTSNSEIATLKNRLAVANDRVAELEAAQLDNRIVNSDVDMESASYAPYREVKQRGHKLKQRYLPLRTALPLEGSFGSRREKFANVLDGLDAFLISSGKFLRYNPTARLLFILYLMLMHLWTFVLVIVHAHSVESIHGDFGTSRISPTGPNAVVSQSISTFKDKRS